MAAGGARKKVPAATGVPVMIRQVYTDYHLPVMPDQITLEMLHFFYDALIPGLTEIQKRAKNGKQIRD